MTDPGAFTAGGRPAIVRDLARAGFTDAVEVGRGGFGVVFRATQEALNRVVAVKLLHTDLDTVSRERFFREGRAMGGLSGHPNVVDVLQVGVTHSGRPYIVMPFQSLDSLAARVRREGPIEWDEATRLGVRLSGALESAHRVGTLHRDVKPANILLSDYGEAQLTDFGIARIEGGFETATGAFTGSLSYTAPEVLNGKPPTPRSDIYGLGAALFSIIAGRAAFERREGEEIIAQFLRITGQPIPDLRGHGVPDDLCAVLEKAMAKDPGERPKSAEELGHLLQGVQRDAGLPVVEMALPVRKAAAPPPASTETVVGGTGTVVVDERSPRRTGGAWALDERPWTSDRDRSPTQYQPTQSPPTQSPPTQLPPTQPVPPPPQYAQTGRGRSSGSGETTAMMADRDGTMVMNGTGTMNGTAQTPRGTSGGGTPPPALPPSGPPADRPRRRVPLIAAVVAVVALLAGLTLAGVAVWRNRDAGPGTGPPPTVDTVTPASAWRALRDSPTPRQQVATTVADGVVWVLGGLTDSGAATTKVEGYDSAIDTWKGAIDLPVPLNHAMAVTWRNTIVVLGGWVAEGSNIKAVSSNKVYAQEGGGWKELPPMLSPHVAGGAVVIGDQIIVSGGQANDQLTADTEVFDGTAWRKVADLPTPREHLGMATDGTYAYVVGGRDLSSDKNSSVLERFDPKTGAWTGLAPMPAPRGGIGAAVADGRLVVAGGEEPTGVDNSVFAYDIQSNTWSSLPDLPQGRHGMAVAAVGKTIFALDGATQASHLGSTGAGQALLIPQRRLAPAPIWSALPDAPIARQFSGTAFAGGKMWVAGGLTQGDATKAVYAFDATIGRWTQGPDLPLALHHTSAVEWQKQLVVIGGWAPQNGNVSGLVSGKVFVLRGNGTWAELPPLNHPRVAHGAVTIGDKIVVFGGQANEQLVAATEVFDGTKWTDAAPIPTPREHMSAATDGTYAYAVGGRNLSSDKNSAAFERFDPATSTWQKLADMPTPRGGVAATYIDGRILAAGGEEPTRVLNTVEAYDIDTGRWLALPPLRVARHGIALATIGNTVFAVGGAQRPTHAASAATVEALDFS